LPRRGGWTICGPNDIVGFVLPPFTESGLLPPGLHRATWLEVVDRFGCTPRRRQLLRGLQRAAANLRDAGVSRLWLDGSFVTAKPDPDDFDGAWDYTGIDLRQVDPVFVDLADMNSGRHRQKAKYGGELLLGKEARTGLWWQQFFQLDQDGGTKGIVLLDLRTVP
jgi:hypothetical protein